MQRLIDQLGVNSSAGEIEEYFALFSFWQGSNEGLSRKSCKGYLKILTLVLIKTINMAVNVMT